MPAFRTDESDSPDSPAAAALPTRSSPTRPSTRAGALDHLRISVCESPGRDVLVAHAEAEPTAPFSRGGAAPAARRCFVTAVPSPAFRDRAATRANLRATHASYLSTADVPFQPAWFTEEEEEDEERNERNESPAAASTRRAHFRLERRGRARGRSPRRGDRGTSRRRSRDGRRRNLRVGTPRSSRRRSSGGAPLLRRGPELARAVARRRGLGIRRRRRAHEYRRSRARRADARVDGVGRGRDARARAGRDASRRRALPRRFRDARRSRGAVGGRRRRVSTLGRRSYLRRLRRGGGHERVAGEGGDGLAPRAPRFRAVASVASFPLRFPSAPGNEARLLFSVEVLAPRGGWGAASGAGARGRGAGGRTG